MNTDHKHSFEMLHTNSEWLSIMTHVSNTDCSKWGDWVLHKVSLATRNPTEGILGPSLEGPYEVVSICRPGTYQLHGSDGQTLGHLWNVDNLKYYYK